MRHDCHRFVTMQSTLKSSIRSVVTWKFNLTWDVEYCMPPPMQCSSMCSFTMTLNCNLLTPKCNAFIPIIHHWGKFGENPTTGNTFQDITLTSPESAVFSVLYYIVTLTFHLLTLKLWSIHFSPAMHRWCKFGENVSNTPQDVVLIMFWDTHRRTYGWPGQKQYASGHTTLGGSTNITPFNASTAFTLLK